MQCRLPKKQTMISTVDVALSGTFDKSYGYVTIDGTRYISAQTLTVAKGTSVTVYCGASHSNNRTKCKITLNGTTVAQGTSSAGAKYTFAVTDNCGIVIILEKNAYNAAITMPA